jgi:SAM-dependent methyltransferase
MDLTRAFAARLRCPDCAGPLDLEARARTEAGVREGALRSACGRVFPVIEGVPRMLPAAAEWALVRDHVEFFARHPDLRPGGAKGGESVSSRTQRAFGDEWQRFPELHAVHARIFRWYFEGPVEVAWRGLRVLDAGCGMGRWLHFALREGAEVVGMDVSKALDVAAGRERQGEFVQADLRFPPFAPGSFDLVYCLGVLHHLEDPGAGLRALAALVRPCGELRFYVYRSLHEEHWIKRALLRCVTALRRLTTRLPYGAVSGVAFGVAVAATVTTLIPRRILRRFAWGDRLTRGLPLVHYTDVPFRMLVAEQFDRLVAPLEGRFRRKDVESWVHDAKLELVDVLPDLGWRVIARKPMPPDRPNSINRQTLP